MNSKGILTGMIEISNEENPFFGKENIKMILTQGLRMTLKQCIKFYRPKLKEDLAILSYVLGNLDLVFKWTYFRK